MPLDYLAFSGEAMARVLGLPHRLDEQQEAIAATPPEDALIGSLANTRAAHARSN